MALNFQMVVIWNTERVTKGGEVSVMAKAHSEVDIVRMKIAAFDDTRSDNLCGIFVQMKSMIQKVKIQFLLMRQ